MLHDKNSKILIVGTGRSGSSLLSAIIADSDHSFGMEKAESWDKVKGAFEHKNLHLAYRNYSRSDKISKSLLPSFFSSFFRRKGDKYLKMLLDNVTACKSSKLVWMIQRIHHLGYNPKIIVQYRKFQDYSRSRYLKFGWSMNRMLDEYCNVYSTSLLMLGVFEGVAVNYESILDKNNKDWAEDISKITGIDVKRLLDSRDRIVQRDKDSKPTKGFYTDNRVDNIYKDLEAFSQIR